MFVYKDIFCINGVCIICGLKMLENFVLFYNVIVIENFCKVGVVCLGKINMDEFVMGFFNEFSYFGLVINFWGLSCGE